MEITYGEVKFGVNEKYSDEILVETSVDTAERGGAQKVLSLEAEAKATSVELMEGEAEVSGKVNYRLLYLDRQSRLCGLDYFKDFKCRIAGAAITPGGKGVATFVVPDAEAKIRGEEVTLSAMVGVDLTYYGEQTKKAVVAVSEAEILAEEIISERVIVKESAVELDKIVEVGLAVKKVILFEAEALPVEVKEQEGGSLIAGEVRGSILYLNDVDEVAELTLSVPFTQEAEEGVKDVSANLKSARVILTDDEEGNAVEVEAAVSLAQRIYESAAQSAVKSVCGKTKTVDETAESVCGSFFVARERFEESLNGTVPSESAGGVCFVRPGCRAVAEVTVNDGEVKVEGVAAFQVINKTQDGYVAEQGELPFSYVLPFAEAKAGQNAEVAIGLTDAVGVSKGKDITVSAKMQLEVKLFEERCFTYLSEAREGGDIPESEAGISVYFAEKGESLFTIAKSMGVLPSALKNANPTLEDPLEENKKVLIFRQK